MKIKDGLDRARLHLPASVIDNLRALIEGTIQDVLGQQSLFKELLRVFRPLAPADQPVDGLEPGDEGRCAQSVQTADRANLEKLSRAEK